VPTIGVISDTHGLLRPEALAALDGSDLILHAGDVGGQEILDALDRIAPVRAVSGNMDWGTLGKSLPATDVAYLGAAGGGPLAYLVHDLADLDLDPVASGFRVVVYGHTHRPALEERDGVLYLNPGSAGPRRFDLPVSVATIAVNGDAVRAEIVRLPV
jgi:putative phosphoesterase